MLLASCATQSGTTLKTVSSVEAGAKKPPNPEEPPTKPPDPSPDKKGLEIVSNPSRADVFIDNDYKGRTPLLLEDVAPGRHLLQISRDGYYGIARWIDFTGEYMLYETTLVPVTGFLALAVTPMDSEVTIADRHVRPGVTELPVGVYTLTARAFGYAESRQTVAIFERTMTSVEVALSPVEFDVTRISAVRTTVNPDNPGILGSLEVSFSVTGPGTGEVIVLDAQSREVYSDRLPPFTTWDQSYRWNCRDGSGSPLPDGTYTFVVSGRGDDGERTAELDLVLDRTFRTAARGLWSGSAGLLYASSTDVLPPGGLQLSLLGAAFADGRDVRAPVALGARIGLEGRVEIDMILDLVIKETTVPFGGSLTARYLLSAPRGTFGMGTAVEAGISMQFDPPLGILASDTLSNFTGLGVGVPLELAAGPLRLLASPSLRVSLWEPFVVGAEPGLDAWMYLRGGMLLDFGQLVAGVSASLRTAPFSTGSFILVPPMQAGAEVHWLIPGTHLLLSGILPGEFSGPADFYLMGGGGLGLLY